MQEGIVLLCIAAIMAMFGVLLITRGKMLAKNCKLNITLLVSNVCVLLSGWLKVLGII